MLWLDEVKPDPQFDLMVYTLALVDKALEPKEKEKTDEKVFNGCRDF